jgi:hypothetical protein
MLSVRANSTNNVEIVRLDIFHGYPVQIWDLVCEFLGDASHFVYVQETKTFWMLTT